jgi:hypothetical protein
LRTGLLAPSLILVLTMPGHVMAGPTAANMPRSIGSTPAWQIRAQHAVGMVRTLYGISCPRVDVCFAVGVGGTIVATTNGGTTWSAQTSGTVADLVGVDCPRPASCIVVGADGTALTTADGGATWHEQDVGMDAPYRSQARDTGLLPANSVVCRSAMVKSNVLFRPGTMPASRGSTSYSASRSSPLDLPSAVNLSAEPPNDSGSSMPMPDRS